MNFNTHFDIEGQHAFLSASKYHWINYDEEKLATSYSKYLATSQGTRLHEFACECIRLGVKLPKSKKTMNLYVNDAIGYKMATEQPLYFSENCFGTADAISFRKNVLRIHDLKTGVTPSSMRQLEVYTSLFCLEYKIDPHAIDTELRLYQSDDVIIHIPSTEEILRIMDKIIVFDQKINKLKIGGAYDNA